MGVGQRAKVELIPWDYSSDAHVQRMYDQRVACGWRSEEVDHWKRSQACGLRCFYWIVLADGLEKREEMIAKHTAKYEKERSPLIDTAPDIRRMPRTPTLREFHPIGHVALDSKPHEDERLGLLSPASLNGNGAKGIFWIGVLYISWELQRLGLGGAAMREVEALAAQKPLNGHTTVLDAVPAEFQLREDVVQRIYLSQGNPVPTVANETWYKRQGYVEFHREENGHQWPDDEGNITSVPLIFMKKSLI